MGVPTSEVLRRRLEELRRLGISPTEDVADAFTGLVSLPVKAIASGATAQLALAVPDGQVWEFLGAAAQNATTAGARWTIFIHPRTKEGTALPTAISGAGTITSTGQGALPVKAETVASAAVWSAWEANEGVELAPGDEIRIIGENLVALDDLRFVYLFRRRYLG